MNLIDRVSQMATEYEANNGFPPDRVLIGPEDREELFKLAAEYCRFKAPLGDSMLLGMRIERGEKTEVRAAKLNLEIAR